jgi:hypothetical protein
MANAPLRGCPTCGTRVADAKGLGLRDYRWLAPHLPGHVAPSDVDSVLETHGHFLVMEYKPEGVMLPQGQRIMLRRLVKGPKSVDVWVVRGEDPAGVEVSRLDARGDFQDTAVITTEQLARHAAQWFDEHNAGGLVT